ncbi:hypothetical protein A5N82_04195 [Christensenella minuta]|uniref:Relaxase/mobilization nuclease domain protein n=1 Tax=Christensenella minuta TaxID=626937 RepID=A0A136Q434_9FIRM|nr:relaxase/mobilization nuclease domain-containing protein [Christensenella minuta]AYH40999.1 mobilization protein [Christensenella minuta]KXK65431.1 relaxase/mobilization nuclease domain protein [Christensenella minuta]OAQ42575.1 hypothetical protein A5N82_04195 [Christensenella minuta]
MAILKAVNSKASIGKIINYIMKHEKTEKKLIGGYNCNPLDAIDEMKATKRAWRKTGGRQYKHFIQSFSKNETITPEEASRIAYELITRSPLFQGYEVCYATHKDRDHIHTHIVVNSVSFEHGYKFRYSKAKLQELKDFSDSILREYGKTICQKNKEITAFGMGTYKAIEKAAKGTYQSWMLNIVRAITKSKAQATSRKDFVQKMRDQGIEARWTDSRKYIVFVDQDGHKVRDCRLSKVFKVDISKEGLENEMRRCVETNRGEWKLESDHYESGRATGYEAQRGRFDKGEQGAERSVDQIRRKIAEISGISRSGVQPDQSIARRNAKPDQRNETKQRGSGAKDRRNRRHVSRDDDRCL